MADQGEHYEMSWILHHILDTIIGSEEIVDIRRKYLLIRESLEDTGNRYFSKPVVTGSRAEGFFMNGSDVDAMFIDRNVKVMCSNQDANIPLDNEEMAIAIMRKAHCRPCYVTLELVPNRGLCRREILESLVPVDGRLLISSEIYAKSHQENLNAMSFTNMQTHGPSSCLTNACSNFGCDIDIVNALGCTCWPPEANEWLRRPRYYGWPTKALIYNISKSGCHVVPVGDKTSDDTFLQWRISFATAERKLVHSLSHQQFLVYGLLKVTLKQLSEMLKNIIGDADILSSYIMKTVIFFAVENTYESLWKEQNTFFCFRLCLKILITWVKAGYCPNYFIINNNMFQGKLHCGNQEKLLHFLMELYHMKWRCLKVGTFVLPTIWTVIQAVIEGEWKCLLTSPKTQEYEIDKTIFGGAFVMHNANHTRCLNHLSKSKTDTDEFIAYFLTVQSLSVSGQELFEEQDAVRGNKMKYKLLRKCKNLMKPFASVCTSPGLLTLATFYYQTGNYTKALMACGTMIRSFKVFISENSERDEVRYEQMFCGRGYTLLHKCQEAIVSFVELKTGSMSFCPTQLRQEMTKCFGYLKIPPLPYAIFLSFLCYHELGDRKRRDTALIQLRAVKYNEQQGSSKHWIVNNLLGICFEMVADKERAIREYQESLTGRKVYQQYNPALDRIKRLQH